MDFAAQSMHVTCSAVMENSIRGKEKESALLPQLGRLNTSRSPRGAHVTLLEEGQGKPGLCCSHVNSFTLMQTD